MAKKRGDGIFYLFRERERVDREVEAERSWRESNRRFCALWCHPNLQVKVEWTPKVFGEWIVSMFASHWRGWGSHENKSWKRRFSWWPWADKVRRTQAFWVLIDIFRRSPFFCLCESWSHQVSGLLRWGGFSFHIWIAAAVSTWLLRNDTSTKRITRKWRVWGYCGGRCAGGKQAFQNTSVQNWAHISRLNMYFALIKANQSKVLTLDSWFNLVAGVLVSFSNVISILCK